MQLLNRNRSNASSGCARTPTICRIRIQKSEGFENRIAELIARELKARVEYTWFAQRRGFVRNTLKAGLCDVVMGVPAHYDLVATTKPYYASSYVFVTRSDRKLAISSIDDPILRRLKIGVHIVGDDYSNPPPVHALSRRGIVKNVSGYMIYGDYAHPNRLHDWWQP